MANKKDAVPTDTPWTIESKAAYDAKRSAQKMSKKSKSIIWLIAGILILGFSAPKDISFLNGGFKQVQTVAGTITETSRAYRNECRVTLKFSVDGTEYTTSQRSRLASCDGTVGKHMWLRYDPADIQGTVTDDTETWTFILPWLRLSAGTFAIIIGSLMLRSSIRSAHPSKRPSASPKNDS